MELGLFGFEIVLDLRVYEGVTVDDINPAIPIIRNIP